MKRIVKKETSTQAIDAFYSKKFNVTSFLFKQQLAFIEDPAPYKVAVCSRRSGKTTACAAHLIHTALTKPGSNCLYITLTRDTAKKLVWKELRRINREHELKGRENDTELSISFPNGSTIYLSGCLNASEIEKFRGWALNLCYIDECQSFREYIRELIDDIIAPALIDYAGSLCLIGTPGPIPAGFFHECAVEQDSWSKHGWTLWDNPHLPIKSGVSQDTLLERELKRRGVTRESPSIRREYFGEWVLDSDSLLLHYDVVRNDFGALKTETKYNYILGVDVGFEDSDALAVLAWSDTDPNTYLIEEIITAKSDITTLAQQIQELAKKYDISKMIMDMGGLGKKIGEELIRRFLIPVEAADKLRKMENYALLDDALRTGRFKAKKDSRFAKETYLVEIDRDKTTPERIKVSNRFHSDIIDAVLYAFKVSYGYTYKPPEPEKPRWGSKEWAEAQSKEMFEAELEHAQKATEHAKWLKGEW
jgi:Phage terminase large subunit